jgi:hypothetical protein
MGHVNSKSRFFVRVRFEISTQGKNASHDCVTANREILMQVAIRTSGLAMGQFRHVTKFRSEIGIS